MTLLLFRLLHGEGTVRTTSVVAVQLILRDDIVEPFSPAGLCCKYDYFSVAGYIFDSGKFARAKRSFSSEA